MSSVIQANYC